MNIENVLTLFGKQRILVVGDIMLDRYITGDVERISPEAPVPVLKTADETASPGGAGNVAVNLKSLGAKVELCGTVGNDEAGGALKAIIKSRGIGAGAVLIDKEKSTTVKTRLMAGNQQIARIDREDGSDISGKAESAILNSVEKCLTKFKPTGIIISDYAKGVVTNKVSGAVIRLARKYKVPVIADPKGSDYGKYKGADTLTPNQKEAESASGIKIDGDVSLKKAATAIRKQTKINNLIITRGAGGISYFGRSGKMSTAASQAREVFDVTGAGDTVVSAFTLSYISTGLLGDSVTIANAAAGIVVGRTGAASVTREELLSRLNDRGGNSSKLLSWDELCEALSALRSGGKKIVFTNGCFDLFHAGHLKLLREARSFGDCLVVALNSDKSVKKLKGKNRPYVNEKDRCDLVSALGFVDFVIVFEEDTPLKLIKKLKPHVLVKGGDYRRVDVVGKDFVESTGGEVRIIKLTRGLSSSAIADEIKNG